MRNKDDELIRDTIRDVFLERYLTTSVHLLKK